MTLYRKYRPQVFADFIGQDLLKNIIQNEISLGQIAHAYLFSGPRGVGKTTMARLIAKALNCPKKEPDGYEPCDQCAACLSLVAGSNLDLIEIDAASNRGIDEIRELKSHIRAAPAKAKYKIFIIDEVHMLTKEAFNALLKTLEEPPAHIIFILATTEKHKLPATIISRCQCFDFKKIAEPALLCQLQQITVKEKIEVDQEVLQAIVRRADGSSRDAISILGQLMSLNLKKISWDEASLVLPRSDFLKVKEFIKLLLAGDLKSVFSIIACLLEEGVDLERFTKDLIEYSRQELAAKIIKSNQVSLKLSLIILNVLIEKLSLFKNDLEIPQLPLEMAAVEIFLQHAKHAELRGKESRTAQKGDNIESGQYFISADKQTRHSGQNNTEIKSNKIVAINQPAKPLLVQSETRPQPASNIECSLTLDNIKSNWHKILEAIKQYNHSLPMALNMCQPSRLEGQVLILACKFPLHVNVFKNQKNREILERVISQITAQSVRVQIEIEQNININLAARSKSPPTAPPSADAILDVFDGDIVKEI